jgi:hypothetical protein
LEEYVLLANFRLFYFAEVYSSLFILKVYDGWLRHGLGLRRLVEEYKSLNYRYVTIGMNRLANQAQRIFHIPICSAKRVCVNSQRCS